MYFLRWESKSWWWTPCLNSQAFWDHREHEDWQGIEIDGPERKSGSTSSQRTWAEICSKARRLNKLGYYTNTKGKPKVQLPTKVAPKEKNHQMLETKKVALFHQGISCLCHGRNVRRWLCATKANYDCAGDGMLEGGFVSPRQIMFVPWMVCKILVMRYQGNSCCGRGPNVGKLPWGAKTNHVVVVNWMLDVGFVAKASSLTPMPSLLYLEAQISTRNISWVDKEAMHSFVSLKLTRNLQGCLLCRDGG
jgi:hypothetical protein